jgi:hypothetical protein
MSANVNFFLNHIQVGNYVHAFGSLTTELRCVVFTTLMSYL